VPFPETAGDRRRLAWTLGLLIGLVFFVLLLRLFALQVIRGPAYADLAQKNLIRPDPIPALRGRIFDRTGALLADNHVSFTLMLEVAHPDYRTGAQVEEAVAQVAGELGLDAQPLIARALRYRKLFTPVRIAEDLPPERLAPLLERLEPIAGLRVERTPRRWYPAGSCAAHALGYVGEVTLEELQAAPIAGGYRPGTRIGRAGLEREYEWLLRGVPGETYVTVDAVGRKTDLFPGLPPRAAVPGADLTVALDMRLQAAAEHLLRTAQPEEAVPGDSIRGAAVVLEAGSGEVLACASVPGFDPNRFASGLSAAEWERLQGATHPLLNRVTQALYPPGSIFKVVTTLAGREAGWLQWGTRFEPCYGSYWFGDREFGCWKPEGHGSPALRRAFAVSCDVYYYQIARRLGLAALLDYAGRTHLDKRTGIDLPEERSGLVPSLPWYRRQLGHYPPEGTALNVAIGQGELTLTPIALAAYAAALVSDGRVRPPRIALRAARRDGTPVWEAGVPPAGRELLLDEEDRALVRRLLEAAVADENATGRQARIAGHRVGGKTGTAQNPHGADHSLFLGVAPMEAPRWVALVIVERGGHGSAVAAPIARELLKMLLTGEGDLPVADAGIGG
jgi:penicillin-binding protein 2